MNRIKWKEVDNNYRYMIAEVGDYMLIVQGAGAWVFDWVVFYNGSSILSSKETYPARSIPVAQRLCEAVYLTHYKTN